MTPKAFDIAWRSFLRRRPFRRFVVELLSGDRLLIHHPEALVIRGDLLYFVDAGGYPHLLQCEAVCQLLDLAPAVG